MTEEQKKKYNERYKRYREKHKIVTFGAKVTKDTYEKAKAKLDKKGISMNKFVTDAIKKLLEE